jgi:hypothetical protein
MPVISSLLARVCSFFLIVPTYFMHLRRLLGSKSVEVEQGTVDSGDIVESPAKYQPAR